MIIAEIGANFCGDMDWARQLIVLVKENGADLAKFQLYDTENDLPFSSYPKNSSYYRLGIESELSFEQAQELFKYGKKVGIEVFFSVFDVKRVEWCEEIGVNWYKVACDRITDELFYAIPREKELIVSYSPQWDKERVGRGLYCIPRYPSWNIDFLLSQIDFKYAYDGLSDHTIGLDVAKIALARGAKIIEKHFAFNYETGVDARWSMLPLELAELKRFENTVKEVL